jgi:Beta-propeller repeat/Putative binding domain, N-terminal
VSIVVQRLRPFLPAVGKYCSFILVVSCCTQTGAGFQAPAVLQSEAKSVRLDQYAKLPLSFERRGDLEFVARGQGYNVDIRGTGASILLSQAQKIEMEFEGATPGRAIPGNPLPGKVNYILGTDARRWRIGLATYERVKYDNLYPGVDLVYYGSQRQLEFDLALKPGADVGSVRMKFTGAGTPRIDANGGLVLGDLKLRVPTVVQGRKTIAARYKVKPNGEVGFEVADYDHKQPLIIDPTLTYSTRLGGGDGYNQANAVALDSSGNAYIAGVTAAADFPVSSAAFAGYNADTDGFISKMNSTGTALIYSTYIGGSNYDYLDGIAVDSTGAAWVVGYTGSVDFPLLSPYQSSNGGGEDAVVVKLDPSGSLAYSTYLGGPAGDAASAVAVDPTGNAYVTGVAQAGFPTTAGVYEPVIVGLVASFVTKFNSSNSLVWSTFVGGTDSDHGTGIAVDEFGNSYIAGASYSNSFPGAPPGGAQPVNAGNGDAFVAKLNFTGSALLYFTFLGGSQFDQANAIAVNPVSGIAVVAGETTSADLTTSTGALQKTNAGAYDGFVAELNAAGSAFLYSTYLGGDRDDFINAVAMDPNGNAYIAGVTDSANFPISSPIQNGIQSNPTSLFQSLTTGASWAPFDGNLPGAATAISPDPVTSGVIVAATEFGIFRTTNGGGSWTLQLQIPPVSLARSPANPSTIYALYCYQVYQSSDDGITWAYQGFLFGTLGCGSDIVADPLNPATAYVFNGYNTSFPAVAKTVNNGVSWTSATSGLPASAAVTAMAAGSDGSLYAGLQYSAGGSPGGVYKSTNGGGAWILANVGLPPNFGIPPQGLVVAPSNASIVYVTDYFTLFESSNKAAAWNTVGPLPGGTNALAVSVNNASTLYYSAYDSNSQIWVSTNSGVSWAAGAGVSLASINRIVPDPLNGAAAYAIAPVANSIPIVAKINPRGQTLLYSTYLGDYGYAHGIVTDGTGDAFVVGATYEFPTTSDAFQQNRDVNYNNLDAFVARISDATASCTYTVEPPQSLEIWYSHFVEYVVTAPSGCAWTASSSQPWAEIVSGASGAGSGIVWVLVTFNSGTATQAATLTIAGQEIPLNQIPSLCGYDSFGPEAQEIPGSGGSLFFNVFYGTGCPWTVETNDSNAVSIVSAASGTGNGGVSVTVAPNLGPNTRTLTVHSPQGDTETISQAGTMAPSVIALINSSPLGASITVSGAGCIPGTYATPASLTWNANTNCTIFFQTPQTLGGSTFTFSSATVNGGPSASSNPLVVNSGTTGVNILATYVTPCTYSLSPTSQSFSSSGGLGSFTMNTGVTCHWETSVGAPWLSVFNPAAQAGGGTPRGTGTGNISFGVASNSGGPRTGTILAGGQTFTVNQAGFTCTYSIGPTTASPSDVGGTVAISVSAPSGCAWTAVSKATWLSIQSGASGSGGGVVVVKIAPNSGSARTGTVTIAGQTLTVNQGAGACGAVDETSVAGVTLGGFTWDPPSPTAYSQQVSVRNPSANSIPGPVYLVLLGQPTKNTGLSVFPGQTTCFTTSGSYLLPISSSGLTPGQSVSLNLSWIINVFAGGSTPNYTTKVLSGAPSH